MAVKKLGNEKQEQKKAVSHDNRYVADWHRRSRQEIVTEALVAFEDKLKTVTEPKKQTHK